MRVRRYVANTAQEAVTKVKRELGPDALILNSRTYKEGGPLGFFSNKRFEALAAVDEHLNRKELNIKQAAAKTRRAPSLPERAAILPALEVLRTELGELRLAVEGMSTQVSRASGTR